MYHPQKNRKWIHSPSWEEIERKLFLNSIKESNQRNQINQRNWKKAISQFLLNWDYESICDPPRGDTLLVQVIHLIDSLH